MSNVVDGTADILMAQMKRLDQLTVAKGEQLAESVDRLKAECERAKAVNDSARNVVALGDLYLRSQMLQMNKPERQFEPGKLFAQPKKVDASFTAPSSKLSPATSWGEGSSVRINELGEFVEDDDR